MAPLVSNIKGTPVVIKNAEIDNNGLIFQNFRFIIFVSFFAELSLSFLEGGMK